LKPRPSPANCSSSRPSTANASWSTTWWTWASRQKPSTNRAKSLGVTQALAVDVTNMISHIEKGIDTREDALVRMSESQIRKFEKDAWDRQEAICEDRLKSMSPETKTPNRKKP
jgi:hypothetical protein